ncbi:MAG: glycosyltransferase family 4 protein [Vicinamibacterales bacterium]
MRAPVLHVIPYLWSGAGGVVTRLCEEQARHGPVTIVTTGASGDQPDWQTYRTRLRRAGVSHHTIDFYHRDQAVLWTSTVALARLIAALQPGVIHAHAGVPAGAAVIARQLSGLAPRLIGQMYSWGPNRPRWMDDQDLWGLGQCDRVVCSAEAYWDLLVAGGVPERKLTYLPWGLPLEQLPFRIPRAIPAAAPLIGSVGRIEPRKGQLELVRAFAALRRHCPGARLELVGPIADARYAGRVRAAVRAAGLGRAVTIAGEVADAAARVRQWDLFVSMSSDEGQGLAVLEAMAIGVPVLARPVAGISDFLRNGRTGYTIEGQSTRSAADALAGTLARRGVQATVRRARRMVERRYSWTATTAAFERLYRR